MLTRHEIQIRVRYSETDAMGFLHHANHLAYFEQGRTELFRASGGSYREMEARGLFLVVVKLDCRYHAPARYDDLLALRTTVTKVSPAKLEHEYELFRDDELIARGHSLLACVDAAGKIQPMPAEFFETA